MIKEEKERADVNDLSFVPYSLFVCNFIMRIMYF